MDFRGIVEDTTESTQSLIDYVLKLDIPVGTKLSKIAEIIRIVGESFTEKLFNDVSFLLDSQAIKSAVAVDMENQIYRLSQKIVRDSAFELGDKRLTKEYLDVQLARVEDAAFANARSLEKHPTLTRIMVGETCEWCQARAGTFTFPEYDDFTRHDDCDCKFIVSGYNSRNGLLKNYKKGK